MSLSLVVAVILRMFALCWLVSGLASACIFLASSGLSMGSLDFSQILLSFAMPGSYITFSLLAWIFAEAISRKVVGASNPDIKLGEITLANLYSVGLLVTGLIFTLKQLPAIFGVLYRMIDLRGRVNPYELMGGGFTMAGTMGSFIVGLLIVLLSPRWGPKLAELSARKAMRA